MSNPLPLDCRECVCDITRQARDFRSDAHTSTPLNRRKCCFDVVREAHRAARSISSRNGIRGCSQTVNASADSTVVCHRACDLSCGSVDDGVSQFPSQKVRRNSVIARGIAIFCRNRRNCDCAQSVFPSRNGSLATRCRRDRSCG